MATVVERFNVEHNEYHNISRNRVAVRAALLERFAAFAGKPVEQTDATDLSAFLAQMIRDGYHPNTVRQRRGQILPFYGWCFDQGLISADTLMRVQRTKNPRGCTPPIPNPYTRQEIQQFWIDLDASWPQTTAQSLGRWRKDKAKYKHVSSHMQHAQINAITHLALHAGMRRDEIFHASLDNIHYDNEYVVVNGARKNPSAISVQREVPMTVGLSEALREWIDLRAELLRRHHVYKSTPQVWLSLAANRPYADWTHPMWHRRFQEMLKTVGKGYRLQRMRHTCATEWLRGGLPLEQVQRLLGHAHLQQTLAYAQILPGDLGTSMESAVKNFERAVGRRS